MPADAPQLFHLPTMSVPPPAGHYSSSYMNGWDGLSLHRQHLGPATNIDYDHNRQIAPLYGTGARSTGPSSPVA